MAVKAIGQRMNYPTQAAPRTDHNADRRPNRAFRPSSLPFEEGHVIARFHAARDRDGGGVTTLDDSRETMSFGPFKTRPGRFKIDTSFKTADNGRLVGRVFSWADD